MPETARRGAQAEGQRERVYAAALLAIAELGPDRTTIRLLGGRLGMSPGHILYYFGSKDRLLAETLHWSESDLIDTEMPAILAAGSTREQLRGFAAAYLPRSAADPRWVVWAHVYARQPVDRDLRAVSDELEVRWSGLLASILRAGIEAGQSPPFDAPKLARRACVFMDGLAANVLAGAQGADRAWALSEATEWLDALVAPASRTGGTA